MQSYIPLVVLQHMLHVAVILSVRRHWISCGMPEDRNMQHVLRGSTKFVVADGLPSAETCRTSILVMNCVC
jgi:hypothetical protein